MTDLGNIETAVKAEATAEVATLRSKVVAFVKANALKAFFVAVSYTAGHFGVLGAVLKALI